MRIQESDIRLSSCHEWECRQEVETRGLMAFGAVFKQASATGETAEEGPRERVQRLLQSLVDAILAAINGKKCRSELADGLDLEKCKPKTQGTGPEIRWQWEKTERVIEHERTRVEGCGTVRTADGKCIDFNFGVDMCRDEIRESQYIENGSVVLHDPLVLSFKGKAAELNSNRFDFDLDSDGQAERIPGLGEGSGFLVLDRNGNGRVDDGSELFGARTGDGFAELAQLDSDGNGWIDEGDARFVDLRLWQGGDDKSALESLSQRGVGALWLGSVNSPFTLKDSANRLLGEIRASGIYLNENGQTGALQQVDLAVEARKEPEVGAAEEA